MAAVPETTMEDMPTLNRVHYPVLFRPTTMCLADTPLTGVYRVIRSALWQVYWLEIQAAVDAQQNR